MAKNPFENLSFKPEHGLLSKDIKPRGASGLGILVIVAILVAAYFVGAKYQAWWPFGPSVTDQATPTPAPSPTQTTTPAPTPTATPDMTAWKTFTSTKSGYEFKYPEKLATQFIGTQTWPPTITIKTGTYSCTEKAASPGGTSVNQKTVNGNTYCVQEQSEGAAGTIYITYTYTTSLGGKLVALNFILRYPQCGNYNDPQKTACEQERATFDLDGLVDQILSTFKFTK